MPVIDRHNRAHHDDWVGVIDAIDIFLVLTGPVFGSFIAAFAVRWPEGRSVLIGRSACPHCHTKLRPADLVPLLSWLGSGGKCRHCGAAISSFYIVVEALGLLIAASAVIMITDGASRAVAMAVGFFLLAASAVDIRCLRLPDILTLPLIVAGLAWVAWRNPDSLVYHLAAAIGGYAFFVLLEIGYRRLRGRDGLGRGDAKLMAAAGAWLGPWLMPQLLLFASLSGLLIGLIYARYNKSNINEIKIPFGPFISMSLFLLLMISFL